MVLCLLHLKLKHGNMFNKLKSILTIVATIFGIISTIVAMYYNYKSDKLKEDNDNLKDELLVKTTEVITYQNKDGQNVTKTIEYTKTIEQLKNSIDSIEQRLYKEYKASSIKSKQIDRLTAIIATGSNSNIYTRIDTIRESDTIFKGTIKYYEDDFISITCKEDSISYIPTVKIDIFDNKRMIPRKIQPFKWINKKWVLNKVIDKGQLEVITNIPNSEVLIKSINVK